MSGSPSLRITPADYAGIELRAHGLLSDVPLHDVWAVDLPGGGPDASLVDLWETLSPERLSQVNPAVSFLFGLRARLGRLFGWDSEPPGASDESYLHRLTDADREGSRVAPGTRQGPFRVLFVTPREAISEARNATVHAFSVFALVPAGADHRLVWAIHVKPVGRITAGYMRLIDPFRRHVIYPAVLRQIRRVWHRGAPAPALSPALDRET